MIEPVTILIPAYNEELAIGAVIRQVQESLNNARVPHEIIVVDDGSTDQTAILAHRAGVQVLQHRQNQGNGASLKSGILAARNDILVTIDGDGTYPAGSIAEMLEHFKQGADMVVGARLGRNAAIPLIRRPAKWLLQRLAEYVTGEGIPDINSGLRAFRRHLVQEYYPILPNGFSFHLTITMAMLMHQYKVAYVPINYYPRLGTSKITPWDFVRFVSLVLRLSKILKPPG